MGRRRKSGHAAKKKKKVSISLLKRENAGRVVQPYRIMEDLVARFHEHLVDAKIAIAWNVGPAKEDADGRKTLGKVKKGTDLDRELAPFDFVIVLEHSSWNQAGFTERQMYALLDNMLCRCAVAKDKNGETKIDEKDRVVYRIRKPDVVEFKDVVARWGLWTHELEELAKAAEESKDRPMLNSFNEPARHTTNGKHHPGETSTTTPAGVAAHDPDAKKAAQIRERAEILNDGSQNCLAVKASEPAHESGAAAFKGGKRLEECPYDPGAEQDDWLRGFLGAELLERYEPEPVTA